MPGARPARGQCQERGLQGEGGAWPGGGARGRWTAARQEGTPGPRAGGRQGGLPGSSAADVVEREPAAPRERGKMLKRS